MIMTGIFLVDRDRIIIIRKKAGFLRAEAGLFFDIGAAKGGHGPGTPPGR